MASASASDLSTDTSTLRSCSRSYLMSEQFFSCSGGSASEEEHPGPAGTGPVPSSHVPRGVGDTQLYKQRDSSSSSELKTSEQTPLLAPTPATIEAQAQQIGENKMSTRNDRPSDAVAAAAARATGVVTTTRPTAPLIRSSSRASRVGTSRWRWLMLAIFALNMAVSSMVFSTFTSSHCVLERYYSERNSGWEDWVRHLAVYDTVIKALLLLPSAWMLVRYELKFTVVFASLATALGTALRLIGASSEHFAVLVAGQLVSSFSSLMLVSVTFFSEVWFSQRERATATAFSAVVGPNLGTIVSYVLGPVVVLKGEKITDDGTNWSYYLMGQALLAYVVFLITVVVFRMAPPKPPSLSRRLEISARSAEVTFCEQLKAYLMSFLEFGSNCFLLFLLPAGIVVGASSSLVSLFGQIQTNSTKIQNFNISCQGTQDIAYVEISTSICSILAALLIAVLIDFTKLFYYLSLIVYAGVVLSVTAFATMVYFSLKMEIHLAVFCTTLGLVGASVAAFLVLGLEYSAEMTFPIPEGTSAAVFYFIGTLLSLVMKVLFNELSSDAVHIVVWVIIGLTIVGFIMLVFVRPELKRKMIDQKKASHQPCECRLL